MKRASLPLLKRRQFFTLLGGATAAWPLAARAQQLAMPVIGFLRSSSLDAAQHMVVGLRKGLSEAGYVEGQNLEIEFRSAEGRLERLPALVAELVQRKVAVIVGNGVAARAAKAATTSVPIVFVTGADPVRVGLVDTFNRPGGNVTGVTFLASAIAPKLVGLLLDLIPNAAVIAALLDPNEVSGGGVVLKEVEAAVRTLGREIVVAQPATEREFDAAFAMFARTRADALYVQGGPLLTNQRDRIVALEAQHGLPAIHSLVQFVEAGGLMSYGPSQADAYRQAGIYAGRIMKGAHPADLPVLQPTKFELAINLRTAKALGLTIPPKLLFTADEVVE